jgi:hypothetical protein
LKKANIVVRVDSQTKERIESAARATGHSISSFLVENALKAADRVERAERVRPMNKLRGARPTWFRAACLTARAGGRDGYRGVGKRLAHTLWSLAPYDVDDDSWRSALKRLGELVVEGADDVEILEWFEQHLPRCTELVPQRRRLLFVEGVREEVTENGLSS